MEEDAKELNVASQQNSQAAKVNIKFNQINFDLSWGKEDKITLTFKNDLGTEDKMVYTGGHGYPLGLLLDREIFTIIYLILYEIHHGASCGPWKCQLLIP